MSLQSIKYVPGKLDILDQLLLPVHSKYVAVKGVEDGWKAINKMQVRGAPAIAIVGCLSLAVEILPEEFASKKSLRQEIEGKLNYLVSARPTAVNMKIAADELITLANDLSKDESVTVQDMKQRFLSATEAMLQKDIADNKAIGTNGAAAILEACGKDSSVRVLTHCNTGSLATAGYGTALGVVRKLHELKKLGSVLSNQKNMLVRLTASNPEKYPREGRVEVSFDSGIKWGTICSSAWSFREGNVVCRQLGFGYAALVNQTTHFGDSRTHPWAIVGALCRGNETRLADCMRESKYPKYCSTANPNVATVRCVPQIADLTLGLREIENSVHLDIAPMTRLQCAMEENCVAAEAYVIRRTQPNAVRYLLRFTTAAENVGNADFSPYANYKDWEWHQCHQHYHSMNVFATFDVYDWQYKKVAQGHKASFCLMDTKCVRGVRPKYSCGNQTQGISVGCADLYTWNLDCQWVDVTGLAPNQHYILRLAINPEYKIGEQSFENNGAECILFYTGEPRTTKISACRRTPLKFRI